MVIRYSIIMPTRNGAKYLPFAIKTILDQAESDFELIISDNHSTDNTWTYLKSLDDPRLKIIQPPVPLSMARHFEFAIEKAQGEWMSILGDDDGLQPYFFELSNELTERYSEYEVITGSRAFYFWKGSKSEVAVSYSASFQFKIVAARESMRNLLFGDSSYFDFPQLYTGTLIKKSFIDSVRKKQGGVLLNSCIVDANSVAIILKNTDQYVYSGIPLAWIGYSPKSTGFGHSNNIETNIADFKKLNQTDKILPHPQFPHLTELSDPSVYFLEALYQNNELNRPLFYKVLDQYIIRHFLFLKVYLNFCKRKENGLNEKYLKLFAAHKLSVQILAVLRLQNMTLRYLSSFINRIKNGIMNRLFKKSTEQLSLSSTVFEEFPTILEASQETLLLYKMIRNSVKK